MNTNRLRDLAEAVQIILHRFQLNIELPDGCESREEVLERMLEPNGILFQEITNAEVRTIGKEDHLIVFLQDGRAAAVLPTIFGPRLVIPSEGPEKHRLDRMEFSDPAYAVSRPFPRGDGSFRDFLKLTIRLLRPLEYLLLIAAPLLVTLLGLLLPKITNFVLNDMVPNYTENTSIRLFVMEIILFVTIGLMRSVIRLLRNMIMVSVKDRIFIQAESAVMARMLLLPERYYEKNTAGGIPQLLSATCITVELILNVLFDTLMAAIFALLYIPQMFSYSSVLVYTALPFLMLQLLLILVNTKKKRKISSELNRARISRNDFLFDALKGMQKIRAYHVEERMEKGFEERFSENLRLEYDPPFVMKLRSALPVILTSCCTVLLVAILEPAGISAGKYLAFSYSYGLLASSILELNQLISFLFIIPVHLRYLRPVFETEPEDRKDAAYVRQVAGNIAFENVSFRYEKDQPEVLKDLSFEVRAGEKVAIVGPSGCGKSTMLKLLVGFLSPDSGEVLYDGKPMRSLNKKSLRKCLGIVLQSSRLMPGTIASNLRFSRPDVTDEQLYRAIEKAQLTEMIEGSEQKLDTVVPDIQNYGFSGGQRQLLLYARGLAAEPNVLILDEAFSALDADTLKRVLDGLFALDTTVIIVSHRLSSVKRCDRILVVQDGKIAESGTYQELLDLGGIFSEMAGKQKVI